MTGTKETKLMDCHVRKGRQGMIKRKVSDVLRSSQGNNAQNWGFLLQVIK